jgi:DNA modification methylase
MIDIRHGDCLSLMAAMEPNTIDAVVTDPPYHLTSIVKRFGGENAVSAKHGTDGAFARASRGFMGQTWDGGDIAFRPETWAEVYRVMKPGAHLVAFGGTRTFHRMMVAIEDAGFEQRDTLFYCYGTGFPKSHNINKAIGDAACTCAAAPERDVRVVSDSDVSPSLDTGEGRRELLQSSVQEQSAPGGLDGRSAETCHIPSHGADEPSLERRSYISEASRELRQCEIREVPAVVASDVPQGRLCDGTPSSDGALGRASTHANRVRAPQGPQSTEQHQEQSGALAGQPKPQDGGVWPLCNRCGKPRLPDGLGTALKPALEPIALFRKPLEKGLTVAQNVLKWGTGALNIDATRIATDDALGGGAYAKNPTDREQIWGAEAGNSWRRGGGGDFVQPEGRWPANLVHDGSDEVISAFPVQSGGSAARFFYSAKAGKADRAGSKHPTVKPVALMQWLVRMITPLGGRVLDPFAGSGTTGAAAELEGFDAVLCEQSAEYVADIRRRFGQEEIAAEPAPGAANDDIEAILAEFA